MFVVVDLYGMVESVSVISTATIGSEGSVSTPSVESETGHQIQVVRACLFCLFQLYSVHQFPTTVKPILVVTSIKVVIITNLEQQQISA